MIFSHKVDARVFKEGEVVQKHQRTGYQTKVARNAQNLPHIWLTFTVESEHIFSNAMV